MHWFALTQYYVLPSVPLFLTLFSVTSAKWYFSVYLTGQRFLWKARNICLKSQGESVFFFKYWTILICRKPTTFRYSLKSISGWVCSTLITNCSNIFEAPLMLSWSLGPTAVDAITDHCELLQSSFTKVLRCDLSMKKILRLWQFRVAFSFNWEKR